MVRVAWRIAFLFSMTKRFLASGNSVSMTFRLPRYGVAIVMILSMFHLLANLIDDGAVNQRDGLVRYHDAPWIHIHGCINDMPMKCLEVLMKNARP